VVTSRPGARAYRVDALGDEVVELALAAHHLGAPEPALVA
jgi:hypothetical protein